ncbi:unnamed protein product [Bursaphelenchus okinawaensis]|uniref:Uncharacterized protein n=1 Tax=Bursaphelenchus okinawaensis TaxID=465554 RepID=A0A811KBF4_9BILA|nr:unnamed protein product [Bursaphelenchus okinawaensis]CAG9097300.1 unnamed protein product [Bursaphelenchus okinawaensis]
MSTATLHTGRLHKRSSSNASSSEGETTDPIKDIESAMFLGDRKKQQWHPKVEDPAKKAEIRPASIKQMMRYGSAFDWLLLIFGILLNILGGTMTPLSSVIFYDLCNILTQAQADFEKDIFDFDKFRRELVRPIVLYFLLGVAQFLVVYCGMICLSSNSERQVDIVRKKFLYRVLHQDMVWFDKNDVGKLTQKLSANADRIRDGSGEKLGVVIQAFACSISGFIIGFILSWQMALIMLCIVPVTFGAFLVSGHLVKASIRGELETYASAGSVAEEVISGIRTVVSMNGQEFELNRYGNILEKGCKFGKRKQVVTAIGLGIVMFLLFTFMGVAFWAGTKMVMDGVLEAGIVFGSFWAIMMGFLRMGGALTQVNVVVGCRMAMAELLQMIDQEPELDCCSDDGQKLKKVEGLIEFENVEFRYPARPDKKILHGVSYSANPGQTIALVGHSGCGKSTMIGLLMRYYTQEGGSVRIDGVDVQKMNVQWLRNIIGVVSQEPVMFATTIEMNLKLGKLDATMEMEKACRQANAHDFISELPQGYKTRVGEGGVKLSGGQKQRLAIARILIRDPKILLLDEATSALDTESERHVQKAIEKASKGRTTITIAHRLSTVRNADKIFVFDHGKIIESGNHGVLMQMNGVYRSLVTAQEIDRGQHNTPAAADNETSEIESSYHRSIKIVVPQVTTMAVQLEQPPELDLEERIEDHVKPASIMQILKFAKNERCYLTVGLLCTLVRGCVWPAFSIIYGHLFKTLAKAIDSNGEEVERMNRDMAISYCSLGVISGLFTVLAGIYLGFSGEMLTKRMRLAVYKNLLCQDASFFDEQHHSTGKLTNRLAIDAPNVQAAIDMRLSDCLQGIVSLLIGLAIAFYFGWQMSLCGMVAASTVVVLQFGLAIYLKHRGAGDLQATEKANKMASESIENVRTVQALTRQKWMYERFLQINQLPYKRNIIRVQLQAASYGLIASFINFNFGIAYALSLILIYHKITNPFLSFQVIEAMTSGFIAIMGAASYFPEYIRATVSAGAMFKLMNAPTLIDGMNENGLKPELEGNINFKRCVFAYPNSKKKLILHDFNIDVSQGQSLALVGPSGCGKSTTILLLERFYDLISGEVLLDGIEITKINIRHLRRQIALVGQEPVLFNLSIKENILYGLNKEEFNEAMITAASQMANAHGFISEFPEAPKGSRLSGGQRQRIAIARAIVRNPKILLLDEATSALDTESEKLVQEALEKACKGRTSITVAHRLSSIQNSDKIAVCRAGKVIEQGNHQGLLGMKGLYYKLAKKQRS